LHGSRFQRTVTERRRYAVQAGLGDGRQCVMPFSADSYDIIGDIISSYMSNMDRSAGAHRAHVGCIIAGFDD
jgi:hypothetical protein